MTASYDEAPLRIAKVLLTGRTTRSTIESYMPSNYSVVYQDGHCVLIAGHDDAGWTLDDYVIPRLASGLHPCTELSINKENHTS